MLPPIDPSLLARNPQFASLYHHLRTEKLHPDGSSRLDATAQKDRAAFHEALHTARLASTRRALVRSALAALSLESDPDPDPDSPPLSEQHRHLAALFAASLPPALTPADRTLLHDDLAAFRTHVAPLARAVALHHRRTLAHLAPLLAVSSVPPATAAPAPTDVLVATQAQLAGRGGTDDDDDNSVDAVAALVAEVHGLHREVVAMGVARVEQTVHGAVARGSRARGEFLAAVAEGMAGKAGVERRRIEG